MTNIFRYFLRVRYSECDQQKVVFNSRYGDYVDLASVEFLRALRQEIEYQVVKQTVEWKASARFDDVLELTVALKSLGNTSFTTTTQMRRAGEEHLIVSADTVYVLLDSSTMQKRSLPPEFRAALEEGARGIVVDHAGYFAGRAAERRASEGKGAVDACGAATASFAGCGAS